jgi:hypothetical protein
MNNKKVIFVGGSAFSGSTILDMMLANGDDGFSTGEVKGLFYPTRLHALSPECGCGDPKCVLWKEIKNFGDKNLYLEIFKRFPNVSHIVDSSKYPFWINSQTQYLISQGIDVKNVLIWKSPLEFAISRYKRGLIRRWERGWRNYYKLYFSCVKNWTSVNYGALVKKPENVLKDLCRCLDIVYFKNKEFFWESTHHTLFGNKSAKVHLYENGTDNFNRQIEISNPSQVARQHRTIYYNSDEKITLPPMVKRKALNDKTLNKIQNLLSLTDVQQNCDFDNKRRLQKELMFKKYNVLLRRKLTKYRDKINYIKCILHKRMIKQ